MANSPTSKRLPLALWNLTGAVTVIGAQAVVPGTLLLDIAEAVHTDTSFLGTVFAVYGLALACSSLVAATVLKRVSLRARLTGGLFGLSAALVVVASGTSWQGIAVGVLLAGVSAGVALPTVYALVPSLVEPARHARAMSRTLLGWAAAFVVAVPIAGLITQFSNWRLSFVALAVSALGVGLLALRLPVSANSDSGPGHNFAVFRDRNLVLLLIGVAVFMATFYGVFAFVGTTARLELGEGAWLSSAVALAYGVGFGLGSASGRWAERHERRLLPLTFVGLVGIYAVLPVSERFVITTLGVTAAWGFINELALTCLLTRIARHPNASFALALYNTVTYLAAAVGTAVAGTLLSRAGFGAVGAVAAVATVLGLLMIVPARTRSAPPNEGERRRDR